MELDIMVQAALITNVLEIAAEQQKYPFKPISTETTRSQQHLKKLSTNSNIYQAFLLFAWKNTNEKKRV